VCSSMPFPLGHFESTAGSFIPIQNNNGFRNQASCMSRAPGNPLDALGLFGGIHVPNGWIGDGTLVLNNQFLDFNSHFRTAPFHQNPRSVEAFNRGDQICPPFRAAPAAQDIVSQPHMRYPLEICRVSHLHSQNNVQCLPSLPSFNNQAAFSGSMIEQQQMGTQCLPFPPTYAVRLGDNTSAVSSQSADTVRQGRCASKKTWKVILTPELAATIYKFKPSENEKKSSSVRLSRRYFERPHFSA
jgi:hypothetical protein